LIRTTRAEIDLGALSDNAGELRRLAGVPLVGVVKADAYGHGAVPVGQVLAASGLAEALAVSLVEEGVALREGGVTHPVLVMGPTFGTDGEGHRAVIDHDLTPV